jgi:hypothetical protein
MVCGAIADAIALTGKLDGHQIRTLVRRTSTPGALSALRDPETNSRNPLNEIPIINHYRLFRVANRIQSRNQEKQTRAQRAIRRGRGYFMTAKTSTLEDLDDPTLYDFSQEALALEESALATLTSADSNCEQKARAFRDMRRSFLLHPTARNRFVLATIYRAMGHDLTANFYWLDSSDRILGYWGKGRRNPQGLAPQYLRFLPQYLRFL